MKIFDKNKKSKFFPNAFICIICFLSVCYDAGAQGFPQKDKFTQKEIIIKFKNLERDFSPTDFPSVDKINKKHAALKIEKVFKSFKTPGRVEFSKIKNKNVNVPDLFQFYKIKFAKDVGNISDIINEYKSDPNIEYAEPNYLQEKSGIPDDPLFDKEWHLSNPAGFDIKATQGWDISKGSPVVIALVDSGVDFNHEDLKDNIWTNSDEVYDNGLDNDNNGYINDIRGWNFSENNNNPADDDGHGTICAGIMAAKGNNGIGTAGVCWDAKIMALKVFPNSYADVCAEAIRYAAYNGAKIISNSWGSSYRSQIIKDAIDYAKAMGAVLVFAAGNNNSTDEIYPACYPEVIAVGATDSSDKKAYFSNYGTWVDVFTPGASIYGTLPNNKYEYMSGTSMACPMVSGLAGLILSKYPDLTNDQVKISIENGCDNIDLLNPGYEGLLGKGRINVFSAFDLLALLFNFSSSPLKICL